MLGGPAFYRLAIVFDDHSTCWMMFRYHVEWMFGIVWPLIFNISVDRPTCNQLVGSSNNELLFGRAL